MPTRRTHIAAVPRRIATPVDFVDKGLTVLHAAVAKVSHRGFDVRVPEEIHNLFQLYTALVQRGRVASPEGVEGLLLTLLAICLAAGPAVAAIQPRGLRQSLQEPQPLGVRLVLVHPGLTRFARLNVRLHPERNTNDVL
jgi:hypothetical protein